MLRLCNHLSVPVTAYDYKTLGDEEFINDTIIDFYLVNSFDLI